ncbi:MAG: hypothetical protein AVDCRST_MAG54-219, partial [uncultured Actinomycetospora sp.]
ARRDAADTAVPDLREGARVRRGDGHAGLRGVRGRRHGGPAAVRAALRPGRPPRGAAPRPRARRGLQRRVPDPGQHRGVVRGPRALRPLRRHLHGDGHRGPGRHGPNGPPEPLQPARRLGEHARAGPGAGGRRGARGVRARAAGPALPRAHRDGARRRRGRLDDRRAHRRPRGPGELAPADRLGAARGPRGVRPRRHRRVLGVRRARALHRGLPRLPHPGARGAGPLRHRPRRLHPARGVDGRAGGVVAGRPPPGPARRLRRPRGRRPRRRCGPHARDAVGARRRGRDRRRRAGHELPCRARRRERRQPARAAQRGGVELLPRPLRRHLAAGDRRGRRVGGVRSGHRGRRLRRDRRAPGPGRLRQPAAAAPSRRV